MGAQVGWFKDVGRVAWCILRVHTEFIRFIVHEVPFQQRAKGTFRSPRTRPLLCTGELWRPELRECCGVHVQWLWWMARVVGGGGAQRGPFPGRDCTCPRARIDPSGVAVDRGAGCEWLAGETGSHCRSGGRAGSCDRGDALHARAAAGEVDASPCGEWRVAGAGLYRAAETGGRKP